MIIEKLEMLLKQHFQKTIRIHVNNSQIKCGKFILAKPNSFVFDLYIKTNKPTTEIISIPIPFDLVSYDNELHFDYDLSKIVVRSSNQYKDLSLYIGKNKTSKFLNNTIVLKFE